MTNYSTHVHLHFRHCLHVFTAFMFMYSLHVFSASLFMYSLHVFSANNHRHMCIVYDNRTTVVPWNLSMNCLHASIHAYTHHHVHILLHTILSLFLLTIVVHICMNTFTIVCMYSLHACSCIHSMFSVHVSTNISASYTTTDRLMYQYLFPCKYSCAYSSSCAHIIVHSNVFLVWLTCSTHVHLYVSHCLHVFTACMFMYSLLVFSACLFMYSLQVLVHVSANISASLR